MLAAYQTILILQDGAMRWYERTLLSVQDEYEPFQSEQSSQASPAMLLDTERAELFSNSGFSMTACTCSPHCLRIYRVSGPLTTVLQQGDGCKRSLPATALPALRTGTTEVLSLES